MTDDYYQGLGALAGFGRTMLKVITFSKEMRPALYSDTNISYTTVGLLPVGRPRTKGFSGVGSNVRMRSTCDSQTLLKARHGKGKPEGRKTMSIPNMYPAT